MGELLCGVLGDPAHQVGQFVGHRAGLHRVIDEFGKVVVDGNARAHVLGHRGTLDADKVHHFDGALHRRIIPLDGSLLREAHESRTHQALHFGLFFQAELHAGLANGVHE